MPDSPLVQRMRAAGLSLWELGDLLGIHPHLLHAFDSNTGLHGQPVPALIDLATRLDMHPADLIPALDAVLANRREPPAAGDHADLDTDALIVLNALAHSTVPLTHDDLATALGWPLARAAAALEHATSRPQLAGPVALLRTPPDGWTVTARLDLLNDEQQQAITSAASYHHTRSVTEANALLAVTCFGNLSDYAAYRVEHRDTEQQLNDRGLVRNFNGPHHAELHPDVAFSLSRHQ